MVEPICLICRKRGCKEHKWLMNRLIKAANPIEKIKTDFFGSSVTPFIGRFNYPNVSMGILAPAEIDKTAWQTDSPKLWFKEKFNILQIVEKRTGLINPKIQINVKNPKGNFIEIAQEVAMAKRTPDTEFSLKKKPNLNILFNRYNAPVGTPAELKKVEITENVHIPTNLEKTVDDYDLKAVEGVFKLYKEGIDINKLMRILSVGLLGIKTQRRMVPTRFSITAIDDIIGKKLREQVRRYQKLEEFLVFHTTYIGNHYEILFIPDTYEYELTELWLPKNFHKIGKYKLNAFSDYEPYWGRSKYAEHTAGAFYTGRLSCLEYLNRIKRQGSILIFREILPSYFLPLGIWQMRETCRGALKTKPERFSSMQESLNKINSRMHISLTHWIKKSKLLENKKTQTKLTSFTKSNYS